MSGFSWLWQWGDTRVLGGGGLMSQLFLWHVWRVGVSWAASPGFPGAMNVYFYKHFFNK